MRKRYADYVSCDLEGVEEVPQHWKILPLKRISTLKGRLGWQGLRARDYTDKGPLLVSSEHFEADKIQWHRCNRVSQDRYELAPEIQLAPGDLLMMKDGAAMGKLAYLDHLPEPACLNSHLLLFRPIERAYASRFLYYVLNTSRFKTYIEREKTGATFFGISQVSMGRFPIPLPPFAEQQAIASFLDRETAKLDALVEVQRRLIALLKEKRQAVVSHAVTRGLDPTVPLKPSGIDWLGDIPAHWEVAPLKRFGKFEAGAGFPIEKQGNFDEEFPFFKVNALGRAGCDDRLVPDVDTISAETASRLRATILPKGTIVFAKIGAALLLGRIRLLPCSACIDNNLMGFIVGKPNNADFFRYLMSLVRFDLIANPGTVPSLNERQIANESFAIPPETEQTAIASALEEKTAILDALAADATRAIALLQERRAALISVAVTGKIDVRDIVTATEDAA